MYVFCRNSVYASAPSPSCVSALHVSYCLARLPSISSLPPLRLRLCHNRLVSASPVRGHGAVKVPSELSQRWGDGTYLCRCHGGLLFWFSRCQRTRGRQAVHWRPRRLVRLGSNKRPEPPGVPVQLHAADEQRAQPSLAAALAADEQPSLVGSAVQQLPRCWRLPAAKRSYPVPPRLRDYTVGP